MTYFSIFILNYLLVGFLLVIRKINSQIFADEMVRIKNKSSTLHASIIAIVAIVTIILFWPFEIVYYSIIKKRT